MYWGPSHAAISVSLAQITASTFASPCCTLAPHGALPNLSQFIRDGGNSQPGNEVFIKVQSTRQWPPSPCLARNGTPGPSVGIWEWYHSARPDSRGRISDNITT